MHSKNLCDDDSDKFNSAGVRAKLENKIARDRLHLLDVETALSDTKTKLMHERENNKSLVKIVHYLEDIFSRQRDQFQERLLKLKELYKVEFEIKLQKMLKEHTENITFQHFRELERLHQEHRNQMNVNEQIAKQETEKTLMQSQHSYEKKIEVLERKCWNLQMEIAKQKHDLESFRSRLRLTDCLPTQKDLQSKFTNLQGTISSLNMTFGTILWQLVAENKALVIEIRSVHREYAEFFQSPSRFGQNLIQIPALNWSQSDFVHQDMRQIQALQSEIIQLKGALQSKDVELTKKSQQIRTLNLTNSQLHHNLGSYKNLQSDLLIKLRTLRSMPFWMYPPTKYDDMKIDNKSIL